MFSTLLDEDGVYLGGSYYESRTNHEITSLDSFGHAISVDITRYSYAVIVITLVLCIIYGGVIIP